MQDLLGNTEYIEKSRNEWYVSKQESNISKGECIEVFARDASIAHESIQ